MKIELSEEQIGFIEKKLTAEGLEYVPLQGELLDHACCMVEERMQTGEKFAIATQAIFDIFGKDELEKLQAQTIFFTHQKSRRMKNIFLVASAAILFLTTFFFFGNQEKEKEVAVQPTPRLINQKAFVQQEEEIPIAANEPKTILVKNHQPPNIKPIAKKYNVHSSYGKRYHRLFFCQNKTLPSKEN